MQQQQKREQENLMKLAQELKNRELDLLGRELKIIMSNAPTPQKRRGRIGTSKLKVSLKLNLVRFLVLGIWFPTILITRTKSLLNRKPKSFCDRKPEAFKTGN